MQACPIDIEQFDLSEIGGCVPLKTPRAAEIFYLMKKLESRGELKLNFVSEACANYIDWKYRKDLTAEFLVNFLN